MIFLSSPYSHKDKGVIEQRVQLASKICAKMVANGEVVISPIVYGHTLLQYHEMPSDWTFWKNYCETFLIKCDKLIVVKMEGWDTSEGVTAEIKFAIDNNIIVEYMEINA